MRGAPSCNMLDCSIVGSDHKETYQAYLGVAKVKTSLEQKFTIQNQFNSSTSKNKIVSLKAFLRASNHISNAHCQQQNYSIHDKLWYKRYSELMDFKLQNGHCNVPQRYASNHKLGKWVHKQKQLLKNKGGVIRKDRFKALVKIGFVSSMENLKSQWHEQYCELAKFQRSNGHCDVPQRYPSNAALGRWVHSQRQLFRKEQLSRDRVNALQSIGFLFCSS